MRRARVSIKREIEETKHEREKRETRAYRDERYIRRI